MDVINPLANALAQSVAAARQQAAGTAQQSRRGPAPPQDAPARGHQAAAKAQRIRRVQALTKDVAAEGDRFEHQVESTEELSPIHDDAGGGGHDPQKKKQKRKP